MNKIFSGWEIKKGIISPLIVNITTGLIIFFSVVMFKTPLLNLLGIQQEVADYPLYCITEPFNYEGNKIAVDLYLINLFPSNKLTNNDLVEFIRFHQADDTSDISSSIKIEISDDFKSARITDIKPDVEFNKNKGDFDLNQISDDAYEILVNDIEENQIVKFVVFTSAKRNIYSKASRISVPIRVIYAGLMRND